MGTLGYTGFRVCKMQGSVIILSWSKERGTLNFGAARIPAKEWYLEESL